MVVTGAIMSCTFKLKVEVEFVTLPAASMACMYQVWVPAASEEVSVYDVCDGEMLLCFTVLSM